MTKVLKIVKKSHFGVIFDHILAIFTQTRFFCKNSTNNSTGSPNPMPNITKNQFVNSNKTSNSEKTEGQTEGWRKNGQKDGQKDRLKARQTLTNPNKPSSHDWGSNKRFTYICQGINHYISQSFFIMTLNA